MKICEIVIEETVIDYELLDAEKNVPLSIPEKHYLKYSSYGRLERLGGDCQIPNNDKRLRDVEKMYERIWADESKRDKIKEWAKRKKARIKGKKVRPEDGPPKGPDLLILSTLANLKKPNRPVQLVTRDNDFLVFSEEIKTTFCIDIVHPRDLDHRPLR